MKQLITDEELEIMFEDFLKNYTPDMLFEDMDDQSQQIPASQDVNVSTPKMRKLVNPVQQPKMVVKKAQPKTIIDKPTSQTVSVNKDDVKPKIKKLYDPVKEKKKQQLNKVQYQIFNIKMRLGKLGLNDIVRRFAQSLHDFDINITKNSKDKNNILSYLSPTRGNIIALKGALESLESEFDKLEMLLEEE